MDKNKKIAIVLVLLLIAVAVYWFYFRKPTEVPVKEETNPLLDTTPSVFPLKFGSRNEEVRKIQAYLLKTEGSQIKIDGIWGKETEGAIKKYLKVNEISQDKYNSLIN